MQKSAGLEREAEAGLRRPAEVAEQAARSHPVPGPEGLRVCTTCKSATQHHPALPPSPPAGRVGPPHPSERQGPVLCGPTVWAAKCKPGPGSCVGHGVKHAFPRDFSQAVCVCADLLSCGQQSRWTRATLVTSGASVTL